MEEQMGALTLEERSKPPSSMEDGAQRVRRLLAATPQEFEIVRPGEFCRSADFCDDQNIDTVLLVYKTLIHEVQDMEPALFRSEFFSRAGEEALVRSIRLNDASALSRAITYGSLAVYHTCRTMPERGIVISAFGRTLRQRWSVSNKPEHLDEAIYYFQKTAELEPPDEANRALHLDDLGCALMNRYKKSHRHECFTEAKESFELAISLQHSGTPMFYSNLGQLLLEKTKLEKPQDALAFDQSIGRFRSALRSLTDQFRGSVSAIYYHMGEAYIARYLIAKITEDWQQAVEAFDESIFRVKPPNANYLSVCYGIGRAYSDVSGKFGDLVASDKAQRCYELALQASPENLTVMASLGEQLRFKAHCTGTQMYLEESILWIEKAVQKTPDDDPELPFRLGRQANALADRFEILGNIADIDQAIAALWRSLEASGLGDKDRWFFWDLLGFCSLLRHDNTQDADDLQIAEMAVGNAFDLVVAAEDHIKAKCFRLSGKTLARKYQVGGNVKDLETSIQAFQKSIELDQFGSDGSYLTFNDLGNAFIEKFEVSGANVDLQAAANSYVEALERLRKSRMDHARNDEAILLHGLGNVQFRQFKEWNRAADLDTAIFYYKKSADSTSESNVRIVTRVATLCWALQERFDMIHKLQDLEDAKTRMETVTALGLRMSPKSTSYTQNRIGMIYLRFFFHNGDLNFLGLAAKHFQAALASGCKDAAYNISAQNNLAITLQHKSKRTKNDVDIMAALVQFHGLLRIVQSSSRGMGHLMVNVADCLSSIYDMKKDPFTGKTALAAYLMAVRTGEASSKRMLDAKMSASRLSFVLNGDSAAAFNLLSSALEDLPEAILTGLSRADKLRIVKDCAWIPSNILAAAIAAGHPSDEALRLFESSRGIIWESLLNEKYDIGPLESQHPDLAAKFKKIQANVRQTMSADKLIDPILIKKRQKSHLSSLEYNDLMRQIRSLEGFESFLRVPQGPSSLTSFAGEGIVVVVNSNEFRSDCLVVRQTGVVTIPLPDMTMEASSQHSAKFLIALSDMAHSPVQASRGVEEVLIWLWNTVAKPVMEELGLLEPNSHVGKPRVWWMVTGWISILPIHAAGDHSRASATGERCSVLDLVTSSYCNSLRSLQYARDSFIAFGNPAIQNALLLQMPQTPDREPLPGVRKEVSSIRATFEKFNIGMEILEAPGRDAVLRSLKTNQIAHFACHGIVDAEDPSLSQLLLEDWKQRPLNVRTLLQTRNIACSLVFLSACESALGKERRLREEGIHIAGGFQMAGVPHVIGTLWQVEDEFGVQVADEFYRGLLMATDWILAGRPNP